VDDFVAHIDWRAEYFQRSIDDLDGTIHAGAEAAWVG
jgi:hypothetical protein